MIYTVTWTCAACGHKKFEEYRVPKYNPPRQPDWRALEKRARCSRCDVRGACTIVIKGG